ncbi:glycosyltransferase [Chitinophaga silvatica]|uniref:Glycosyltransferase n=1 Tax=Chitinophaga silvatica TaxID=2282649 RepID=A0A3E1YCE1_9BACT|nr:glycosyltransferase [Chitinophaga silvatica]RFS23952.1 glycosyltransferase [Chitinophaga silvatica]
MVRKKNILLVVPSLQAGGSERVISILFKELKNLDSLNVYLAVLDGSEIHKGFDIAAEDIIDLQCKKVRYSISLLKNVIKEKKIDLVLSTLGYLNLYIALFRFIFPSKVTFIGRESSIVSENIKDDKWPKLFKFLYKRFYKKLDGIICQSNYMCDDLIHNFKIPSKKITIINNPIDTELVMTKGQEPPIHNFDPNNSNILAVGRLNKVKGFERLIPIMAKLQHKNVKLYIAGSGAEKENLLSLINFHSLNDSIILLGHADNPYPLMAQSDILIMTSYYEGFPNVAIEMLSLGKPVIAYDAPGGIKEIVQHGRNGYIVESDNPKDFSDYVIKVLESEPFKEVELKKSVKHFNKEIIINKYVDYFNQLINQKLKAN